MCRLHPPLPCIIHISSHISIKDVFWVLGERDYGSTSGLIFDDETRWQINLCPCVSSITTNNAFAAFRSPTHVETNETKKLAVRVAIANDEQRAKHRQSCCQNTYPTRSSRNSPRSSLASFVGTTTSCTCSMTFTAWTPSCTATSCSSRPTTAGMWKTSA